MRNLFDDESIKMIPFSGLWGCFFVVVVVFYYYFIIIFISSSSRIVKSAQQVVNGKTITSTILNKTMDIRKENTLTK